MLQTQSKEKQNVTQSSSKAQSEFTVMPQPKELIQNSAREELRMMAKQEEKTTEFGSASYVTHYKSRGAAFTRTTVDKQVTQEDRKILRDVHEWMKENSFVEVTRQMCQGDTAFVCRLWVWFE